MIPKSAARSARREPPLEIAGSEGVLEAIAERGRTGRRDDGRRIGLVVEGGAMRAVVSGGSLVGLEDLGLLGAFDVGFGASAGALNLAYFAMGRAAAASEIYLRHLVTSDFVNPLRLHRILDVDHVFDRVIPQRFPLDREALRHGSLEVKVSVTDATTGRNRLVSLRDERVEPAEVLRATAAVPFYYGRRVRLLDRDYVDGMASDALPVRAALEDGCTHVLVVLSTRPGEGSARRRRSHEIALPERVMLGAHPLGFRRAYLTRRRRLRLQLALAHHDERIHVLHPGGSCPVPSRICLDAAELERALAAARRRARELFESRL